MQSLTPSDHILTQLELTNNPGAVPNVYTNFGAVPTPIYIQRPGTYPQLPPNAFQNLDLDNLGSSLNESRLALAMEMARLDVERMKFVEPPITITKAGTAPLKDSVNLPAENSQQRGRTDQKMSAASKNPKGVKGGDDGKTGKQKKVKFPSDLVQTTPSLSVGKNVEEIGKSRVEIAECVRWMAVKASQPSTVARMREPEEEKKLENRVNQQTIRSARNLYSLQQQIRQAQSDVDKLNADGSHVNLRCLSESTEHKTGHLNSVLNKVVNIHRSVAKIARDVATVSREGVGVEKQFSRTYSEIAHLIRQLNLINDQLGIENVDCHVEILDGLSAGDVVSPSFKREPTKHNVDPKTKHVHLPPQGVHIDSKRNASPALSPDREETLRAGILALGIDKILDRENVPKGTKPESGKVVKKPAPSVRNAKRNVIYTTTRTKVPAKLTKTVKSNILQSTVASQLKSVHSDMLIRNPISDISSANSSLSTKSKPKSSSPVNLRANESLCRLRDSIDQSTILSSSRRESPSPNRENFKGKRSVSPKARNESGAEDGISLKDHEEAEQELKNYLKETNKMVAQMKQEREFTKRFFDAKKGMTPEAYSDIRDICRMKLMKYAEEDKDARAVMNQIKNLSDPTFRYLVKECSFGYRSFNYEEIADRVLDFLVEQRMAQTKHWKTGPEPAGVRKKNLVPGHRNVMDSKTVDSVKEMLRRLDKIEEIESEISQRLNAETFMARAYDSNFGQDDKNKEHTQYPFKYVHFRDYPSVIDSPKSGLDKMTTGDLIIVNKGKGRLKPSLGLDQSDDVENSIDGVGSVARTEVAVDENLSRAINAEIESHQRLLASNLEVDLKKVNPSGLLDEMTHEILQDCLEGVLSEFSNACDGFAQTIYMEEFEPSSAL